MYVSGAWFEFNLSAHFIDGASVCLQAGRGGKSGTVRKILSSALQTSFHTVRGLLDEGQDSLQRAGGYDREVVLKSTAPLYVE